MSTTCTSHDAISGVGDTYSYSTLAAPGFDATVVDIPFMTPGNTDFPFKPFFSGNGILIDETTNAPGITISYTGAPGAPYTYSTIPVPGAQASVVATQVGNDFPFKPFLEGTGIDISEDPTAITIASNLATDTIVAPFDATVVAPLVGNTFTFRGLAAGAGITLTQAANLITIDAIGSPIANLFQNNTLFVDQQYGNDGTGVRERRDLPFATISAAIAASSSNDTIYILPGIYSENLAITQILQIYCEDGVFLEALSPNPFITLDAAVGAFTFTGFASINNAIPGQYFFDSTTSPAQIIFQAKTISSTSAGIFTGRGSFTVEIHEIEINTGVMFNNVGRARLITNTLTSGSRVFDATDSSSLTVIANRIDVPAVFATYSGTSCTISITANYIRGATGVAKWIDIEDTTVNAAKSNVNATIIAGIMECDQNLAACRSAKPNIAFYPTVNIRTNAIRSVGSTNAEYLLCAGGNFIITAGEMIFTTSSLNSAQNVFCTGIGSVTVKCTGTFNFSGANTTFITSAQTIFAFDCGQFIFSGTVAGFGSLHAQNIIGTERARFLGNIAIDTPNAQLTNSTNDSIIQNVNVTDNIFVKGGIYVFNLGVSNAAIESNSFLYVDVSTIQCTYATIHAAIRLTNDATATINIQRTRNTYFSFANTTNSRVAIGQVADSGVPTIPYFNVSNSVITATIGRMTYAPNANSFVFSGAATNATLTVGVLALSNTTGTFPAIFITSGATLALNANVLVWAPTVAGSVFINNSTSNLLLNAQLVDCENANSGECIFNFGAANSRTHIVRALLNDLLLFCSTGSHTMHCQRADSTSGSSLFDISGGTVQISGTYITSAANVATLTNTPAITIQAAKLVSSSNCITSAVPVNVQCVPSIATNVPNANVTIVPAGALLVNPLVA